MSIRIIACVSIGEHLNIYTDHRICESSLRQESVIMRSLVRHDFHIWTFDSFYLGYGSFYPRCLTVKAFAQACGNTASTGLRNVLPQGPGQKQTCGRALTLVACKFG